MTRRYIRNVPDAKGSDGLWLKSFSPITNERHYTRAGMLWMNMNTRCSEKFVETALTYSGCTVGFRDFQEFAEWCQTREGYLERDGDRFWQLDKDLLIPNNKVYSSQTCLFVPSVVNTVVNSNYKSNGLLQGVSLSRSRFTAYGPSGYLGAYETEWLAHKAWKKDKVKHIMHLIEKFSNFPKLCTALEGKVNHLLKYSPQEVQAA